MKEMKEMKEMKVVNRIFKSSNSFKWIANLALVFGFLVFVSGCFIFYSADMIASKAQIDLIKKIQNISK